MMQQMEIRSRQNREDATLSCSLGTVSPYCFTNHLPALLHILTYQVTYMLPNCITLHTITYCSTLHCLPSHYFIHCHSAFFHMLFLFTYFSAVTLHITSYFTHCLTS